MTMTTIDQEARSKLISRLRKRMGSRRMARAAARRYRFENGRNSYTIGLMWDEKAYPDQPKGAQ